MKRILTIKDPQGLHARPASKLSKLAGTLQEETYIEFEQKKVPLKSIMAIMSLGIPSNSPITLYGSEESIQLLEQFMQEEHLI